MKPTSGIAAIAFAVLTLASTAALADGNSGFYIGGGVGYAGQKVGCAGVSDCSNSNTGVKLLGGYQITPNLAIESSYGDTGKSKLSVYGVDASIKTRSFTVAAVGLYPVTREVELFGKLGAHATKTSYNLNYAGFGDSGSFNASGVLLGLGAQYRFTPKLIGRIEYERLSRAVRIEEGRADIDLVTASVIYQF